MKTVNFFKLSLILVIVLVAVAWFQEGGLATLPFLFAVGIVLPATWAGKAMYDTTQPGGEHAEDVSPLVEILSAQETPLLNALGIGSKPATNVRHEWLEDALIPDGTSLNVNVAPGDTIINVPDASIFQTGELVSVGALPNNELWRVTFVDETNDQIWVDRGYGATIPLAFASGVDLTLLGEVSREGAYSPLPQKTSMDRPYNITHIFNYGITITGTREASMATLLHQNKDEWAYEIRKRLTEALRDLEATILGSDFNFVGGVPSIGGTNLVRTMRGIVNFLRYGVYIGGTLVPPPADCYRNMAATSFTYDNFRDFQQQAVFAHGARGANLLLIPPALKISVAKWKRTMSGIVIPTTTMENPRVAEVVGEIMSDFGPVTVIMDPRLAQYGNVSLLLSRALVKPINYVSRSFFVKDLGVMGDLTEKELIGEYTLEMVGVSKGFHSLCMNWAAI